TDYQLDLKIEGNPNEEILKDLKVRYLFERQESYVKFEKEIPFVKNSTISLNYDDILYDEETMSPCFGSYKYNLYLYYKNQECYRVTDQTTDWKPLTNLPDKIVEKPSLNIRSLSLLTVDKKVKKAKVIVNFEQKLISGLSYELNISSASDTELKPEKKSDTFDSNSTVINKGYFIIDEITLLGDITDVKLILTGDNSLDNTKYIDEKWIQISSGEAKERPEIVITNTVPSLIRYNNVYFSWIGYVNGKYNEEIQFLYNFDSKGWSEPNSNWRDLQLYNLNEGVHSLSVKALYKGLESSIQEISFFVDINKPQFDRSKFTITPLYNRNGIPYEVIITGKQGAIRDMSLKKLYVKTNYGDNEEVKVGASSDVNMFVVNKKLNFDGENIFTLTAYDKVGNYTEEIITIDNPITRIIYPVKNSNVKYAPLTVTGQLQTGINSGVDIYLFDVKSTFISDSDFSGWKKAKINHDKTFFIEDVNINPGIPQRESTTRLIMASVFKTGEIFYRYIDVNANEITIPIDMKLSTHCSQGGKSETVLQIDCRADIDGISSWSVDFDGDGIYDIVDLVSNPSLAKEHKWEHIYSTIGVVKPRVRIITNDPVNGSNYFSVSDEIYIHETITKSASVIINNPISLSAIPYNGANRVFVLSGTGGSFGVDVYRVEKNEDKISNRLFNISLNGFGLENPVKIKAMDNTMFYIADNYYNIGRIFLFRDNGSGNYLPDNSKFIELDNKIYGMDIDKNGIYVSYYDNSYVTFIPLVNGLPDVNNISTVDITLQNVESKTSLKGKIALTKDIMGLLTVDFNNHRIARYSNSLKTINYFGTYGIGEKEFLQPTLIRSFGNRIFVYDKAKLEIQVFNQQYKNITKLNYEVKNSEYLGADFINDIRDMDAISKEEKGKIYYYSLLLSGSRRELTLVRLPQWDMIKAKARNNKIVFLKDMEVYTAKPNGGDLARAISSDSLPRIEGKVDFPALSPDGNMLVFTSKKVLYNGIDNTDLSEDLYEHLYKINVDGSGLRKISLGFNGKYEIERPVFNSNGDKIIFSAREVGGYWKIWSYDVKDGGSPYVLMSSNSEDLRFPYFSPDDRYIVYTAQVVGADEEIFISDISKPNIRISLTNNNARDSYPVWSVVYPHEITNPDLKINSKIAFVSNRKNVSGMYYTYIKKPNDNDLSVVTRDGKYVGTDPDSAAILLTKGSAAGDYPAFTGDGKNLVYEFYNGNNQILKKYDFEKDQSADLSIVEGATRPAGMKNTITNFNAIVDGNSVRLSWSRYVEKGEIYRVTVVKNSPDGVSDPKWVYGDNSYVWEGLEVGVEYLCQITLIENDEEIASTQVKKIKIRKTIAKPTFTIDPYNPYLIHFKGWKPTDETLWKYTWIIDGKEVFTSSSRDYSYEFGTSGPKYVQLKVSDREGTEDDLSQPMKVDVISDIIPFIEPNVSDDASTLTLDPSLSKGDKIDWATAVWTITGPGVNSSLQITGFGKQKVTVNLTGYKHYVNAALSLKRRPVDNQQNTDTIVVSKKIDINFKEVKPIITYTQDEINKNTFKFDARESLGNINWETVEWYIYADGVEIKRAIGSNLIYTFPENSREVNYSVTLTVTRANDGVKESVSSVVCIKETPMKPIIDTKIVTLKEGNNTTGVKLILSCTNSIGSSIDFNSAEWAIPIAGNYQEQPRQTGAMVIYNLITSTAPSLVEVSLTLKRKGGTDAQTITKTIRVDGKDLAKVDIKVNTQIEQTTSGKVIILDALGTKGPNIEWDSTEWLLDGQYARKGAIARFDVAENGEKQIIQWVCNVKSGGKIYTLNGKVNINKAEIKPLINVKKLDTGVFEMDVLGSEGFNIDWERTMWYIYDGNSKVTQKQGPAITHAFAPKQNAMGYPVMVSLFFKGSSLPFVGYKVIDIEGDTITPIIKWEVDPQDKNVVNFTAESSTGSDIDWSQSKWTFGDGSETQYGVTATHKYGLDANSREYKVSLTLYRRQDNGSSETKTATQTVRIADDKIFPVIKAKLHNNGYLVLSAEESEGRGLLLDRSVWIFEGQGDSSSYSK
ncbi:MAG TPA: PKD domain-containing protein, partial [Spirochaetota bacterium]|nr:PKD domain-containing protein [Spirochaetota bacterium]